MKSAFFGVLALDDITLPSTCLRNVVGGSASYGALAAGIFCESAILSVLGRDFPKEFLKILEDKHIDISLLQKSKKPSFKWVAEYSSDLSSVKTVNREMNSFGEFDPKLLKGKLKTINAVFVSKNDPLHQLAIFKEVSKKAIKIMESRGNWITNRREDLKNTLKLADVFMVHEDELKMLVGKDLSLPEMIEKVMQIGPKVIILMRGEHGLVMYGKMGTLIIPSYPLAFAIDPTGAGDVLGGALAGVLGCIGKLTPSTMRKALILASMTASFVVEDYGVNRLIDLKVSEVINRTKLFMSQLPTSLDVPVDCKKAFK